jgi:ABC-type dipeptide/oligopeptide/nickel transport system permease subunit
MPEQALTLATPAYGEADYEMRTPRPLSERLWSGARHHIVGVIAGFVVLALVLVAVFAPVIATHSPTAHEGAPLESPSSAHFAGTDHTGRDVFSRTVYGSRVSLGVAFIAVSIGTVIGVVGGLYSGLRGGMTDRLNQFTLDVGLSFPGILPLLVAVGAFGSSFWVLTLAIAFTTMPIVMRVVRGAVLKEKELSYIEAARTLGATDRTIVFRHLLPNVTPLIIVLASAGIPAAILAEAALSFLGLGIQPPTSSWGGDLSGEARRFFEHQPWMALAPGIALSLSVLAFNLLGDTMRDVLDPRMRGGR